MKKDFHYYCVFTLANLSGYQYEDSQIIAYCSQYVDDSTDSEEIKIGDYSFDTVRTAHMGLRAYDWNIQKKVYLPFHFIPPEPFTGKKFSYVTEPDSKFVNMLIKDVLDSLDELRLFRLGVALHTYADTWAHEHFSGRNDDENDVEDLNIRVKNRWKAPDIWESLGDHLEDFSSTEIGHSQAFNHPDSPNEEWRFYDYKNKPYYSNNTKEFTDAAHKIFHILVSSNKNVKIDNPDLIWEKNKDKIIKAFSYKSSNLKKRCEYWQKTFPKYFVKDSTYHPKVWRKEAMKYARDGKLLKFKKSNWAKFHKAALIQRFFVLQNLM